MTRIVPMHRVKSGFSVCLSAQGACFSLVSKKRHSVGRKVTKIVRRRCGSETHTSVHESWTVVSRSTSRTVTSYATYTVGGVAMQGSCQPRCPTCVIARVMPPTCGHMSVECRGVPLRQRRTPLEKPLKGDSGPKFFLEKVQTEKARLENPPAEPQFSTNSFYQPKRLAK